nr:MAG TPA: hypothetical protein [Caudoviricetes sp.]
MEEDQQLGILVKQNLQKCLLRASNRKGHFCVYRHGGRPTTRNSCQTKYYSNQRRSKSRKDNAGLMAESNEDENNDVQMKEICVIPIDQPGHKPVTKKMSQAFFFVVSSKNGNFAN